MDKEKETTHGLDCTSQGMTTIPQERAIRDAIGGDNLKNRSVQMLLNIIEACKTALNEIASESSEQKQSEGRE